MSGDDVAVEALIDVIAQLELTVTQLHDAVEQSRQVLARRTGGRSWHDIVVHEPRPLIIERVSQVLVDLGVVGSRFRREQAMALTRDGLRPYEISKLFGVSRQRVSALVQPPPPGDPTS